VARRPQTRREGFALLMVLIALTVLAVLVTDLHETTGMSFTAATAQRDQLRAEFMAKSGVNLTRMLIGQEKNVRQLLAGPFQLMTGRPPPQLPVWRFANALLRPFADFESAKIDMLDTGVDVENAEGLGHQVGTFEVRACSENGKININDPRLQDLAVSQAHVSTQLYGLFGGYMPSPNKYDPLFTQYDEKGRQTTRFDLIANAVDWWDEDQNRATFDPLLHVMRPGGAEDDDYYRSLPEPYRIRNAPFDTLEELRLVRGMSDDVWASFVEPTVDDPDTRQVSIYGGSRLNPNEADPMLLLSRVCTMEEIRDQLLCNDPTGMEPLKFINLLMTMRSMTQNSVPFFSRAGDFTSFVLGKDDSMYGKLKKMFGGDGGGLGALFGGGAGASLLFKPPVLTNPNIEPGFKKAFTTSGYVFTIEVTGRAGTAQRVMRTVINTDPRWTPPKPNAGKPPPLGVFAYYRLD
jgi:general secretion pathway protein K